MQLLKAIVLNPNTDFHPLNNFPQSWDLVKSFCCIARRRFTQFQQNSKFNILPFIFAPYMNFDLAKSVYRIRKWYIYLLNLILNLFASPK